MNIQDVIQESYKLWHVKYIKITKEWELKVDKNPFIAIKSHIHEDTVTDLLAHILKTNSAIKIQFIKFLLNKANVNKKSIEEITDEDVENTEIKTQYSINKSRLDLFIKIPDKYHIIIENKIFGDKEQRDQMKRYIKEINKEIKKETVLAFYATCDGLGECQTAGENDKVIPLAFYSDDDKEQTIYKVLDVKPDNPLSKLTQDFCFYLEYRFLNQQSVSFLQKLKNEYKIDLCSQKCFEELFKGKYPSISKNINAYRKPYEYFIQLLKVHALNCYLLKKFEIKEFEKDNCYHAVFDGIRVKRQAKIDKTDCNVYFETKYDKNYFFMVITICSPNEIYEKIKKLLEIKKRDSDYFFWYKEKNKLNKKFTYSLWLWIMDPIDIERNKENLILNKCNNYKEYIEFIFTNCMKEIFDAITEKKEKKEIDEALENYEMYYHRFHE